MATIQEFDYSIDILRSLLWRHNEAPNLQALLQYKQDWINENQQQFWEDWYTNVFDLRTANEFGVVVWTIILGLPLTIKLPPANPNESFGFGEFRKNFENGNFNPAAGDGIGLNVENARKALRVRYYQLTTRGDVYTLNTMMNDVFGEDGGGYVVDNLDMTMDFVFLFELDSSLKLVLEDQDILPAPSGVIPNIVEMP